ncbi:MAG: polyribonucleotide nucleotidyltransferase, partial [Planctomycetes bacterium]|nr:polyribonucleotide nucleotidyltransferase [Planctomycetota bacterium]
MAVDKLKQQKHEVSVEIGGRTITFETGWLAKQAAGSVLVREQNSAVFVAVTRADPRPGLGFFPMTVEYREKTSAAGKFPGGFFKREARPSAKEILTMRMTDRPLRPMFKEGYVDETQINGMAMSADPDLDPDMLMINGGSCATMLSGLPFDGPVGAVRMGRVNGEFVVNPTYDQVDEGELNMVVAGTLDGISMVEAGANELTEDQIIEALQVAHESIVKLCKAQLELVEKVGVEKYDWTPPEGPPEEFVNEIREKYYADFKKTIRIKGKHERTAALKEIKNRAVEEYNGEDEESQAKARLAGKIVGGFKYDALRDIILNE